MSRLGRCEKVLFLISQSLDRKLSFLESLALRWHFFMCKRCGREKEALIIMQHLLHVYREDLDADVETSTEMLSDETREKLKNVLRKRMEEKKKDE